MTVGNCRLIAVEGTSGTGKTTTCYALTARLKEKFAAGTYCDESARANAFVEDFTIHGIPLSMHIELHLLTKTIADQILATRHNTLLVCDKTPVSLIGYIEVLMAGQLAEGDRRLLAAMRGLLDEWCYAYDLMFLLRDCFDAEDEMRDPIRAKVASVRSQVEDAIATELHRIGIPVVEVPAGLALDRRVDWMLDAAADLLTGIPAEPGLI
jgi:hypothetical protein